MTTVRVGRDGVLFPTASRHRRSPNRLVEAVIKRGSILLAQMKPGDPLQTRLLESEQSLTTIRAELKDINFRLDYLIERFRDHFGP